MPYDINSAHAEILKYLEQVQGEIIQLALEHKPYAMNASGKTLGSLEVVATSTGGALLANETIIFMETGRGPTERASAGGDSLLDIIKQWITDKGLDLNPYAVTKKIHKEGTQLYRSGGGSGILSIPLSGAGLNELCYEVLTDVSQVTTFDIYNPISQILTV